MNPISRSAVAGFLLASSVFLLGAAGNVTPVQTGASLSEMVLKDQHDQRLTVGRETRIIFVAAEMAASRMMTKALEALPPTTLKERQAVYIADISSMPEPISTIVAMPKMRKLPYAVAVVRNAGDVAHLPRKPGAVTVVRTEGGTVRAVDFASSAEALGAYLK
ncbi:MAG TPA: hypothetical protein VGE20_15110 [Ramlibacter sp.]